ncbi:MAG: hypothetical protein WC836_23650 [Desulfobacula sp.]|jgi:spore coat polysaccharide biosynthesis predicted glycosyltransferase SpsG
MENIKSENQGFEKAQHKIAFRLDGGPEIGMGHVVRCLAIAASLNKRIPVDILFVVNKSPEVISLIKNAGFDVIPYGHKGSADSYNILYNYQPDIIFNDLPHSSASYMKKIQSLCRTINYDDGGEGCIYADYLFHVQYKTRTEFSGNKGYLCGLEYLILRDEFSLYRKKESFRVINHDPQNIMIMMGGSDPDNLTTMVLKDIQNLEYCLDINIVIGAGYIFHDPLNQCIKESKHSVALFAGINAEELLNLMKQADIGIAHYGITGLEMACTGLPLVAIAHNREEFTENRLTEYGFCIDAGLWDNLKEGDILSCVNQLITSKALREQVSKRGMKSIDAKGLHRVIDLLIKLQKR